MSKTCCARQQELFGCVPRQPVDNGTPSAYNYHATFNSYVGYAASNALKAGHGVSGDIKYATVWSKEEASGTHK